MLSYVVAIFPKRLLRRFRTHKICLYAYFETVINNLTYSFHHCYYSMFLLFIFTIPKIGESEELFILRVACFIITGMSLIDITRPLNLPEYSFHITNVDGKEMIFDSIRRKYVKLTPEEWVRQNFIRYLINDCGYPSGLLGVEVMSPFNKLKKRVDVLVHNREGRPIMIVECKAPDVPINEKVFDQIVCYNMGFKVPYLVVTNGIDHYACKIDTETNSYGFLLVLPLYEELIHSKVCLE